MNGPLFSFDVIIKFLESEFREELTGKEVSHMSILEKLEKIESEAAKSK